MPNDLIGALSISPGGRDTCPHQVAKPAMKSKKQTDATAPESDAPIRTKDFMVF
jgi:hypothetical protein